MPPTLWKGGVVDPEPCAGGLEELEAGSLSISTITKNRMALFPIPLKEWPCLLSGVDSRLQVLPVWGRNISVDLSVPWPPVIRTPEIKSYLLVESENHLFVDVLLLFCNSCLPLSFICPHIYCKITTFPCCVPLHHFIEFHHVSHHLQGYLILIWIWM